MRGLLTITVVLVVAAGNVAHAAIESELVKKGIAAYDALEFESAIDSLNQALAESLTREERIITFRTLGFAYVALDRGDEARSAFVRLMHVDPSAQLDRTVAPKVRALFEEARAQVATGAAPTASDGVPLPALHPTVTPAQPGEGRPLTIAVVHPGGVAHSLHLFHRVRGELRFSEITAKAGAGGRFELIVPGTDVRAPAVEYYLIALDDGQATVAFSGTLGQPLVVDVAARKHVARRRWIWGVAAGSVLVAGGVLAAVLATTLGQPNPKASADVTLIAPR